ncbi:MAG: DUF2244 domain-containing protein [Pseudomonadota bacterium]
MVDTQIIIGPNASLSMRQAVLVLASVSFVALTVAVGFTLMGFWPILPFAGLELAALGAALWVSLRRNRYREVLSFEAGRVRVGFGWMGQGASAEIDWPRPFTRVVLEPGATRNSHNRLVLTSSGQRIEIGRCLTDAEREALHARIKDLLPPVWSARLAEVPGEGPAQQSV